MKTTRYIFLALVLAAIGAAPAQTAGTVIVIPASPTASLLATAGTLNCSFTAPSAKNQVTANCQNGAAVMAATVLDVSQASEAITYSVNLGGNAITAIFTQAATVGTLSYSVTANGSTPKTGNF